MRDFIIFFNEKEGTSPVVRVLDNFDLVEITHQKNNVGWEPFDSHNCGPMPLRTLKKCLNIIYGKTPLDFTRLNNLYCRTSVKPLEKLNRVGVVGLKMRFIQFSPISVFYRMLERINSLAKKGEDREFRKFKRMMIEVLRKNNLVVFLAVRQDLLRWGLSKYHGDGTGKPGQLQFKLAGGEIDKEDIKPILVDIDKFEKIISECEEQHIFKKHLMNSLKKEGIPVYPLCYEDFLSDKHQFFNRILDILEIDITEKEIEAALNEGMFYQKVHSNKISDFVENHEEIERMYGDRFISWSDQ